MCKRKGERGCPPWWSGGARAGFCLPNLADADLAHAAAYFVEEIEAPVGEREVPVHR